MMKSRIAIALLLLASACVHAPEIFPYRDHDAGVTRRSRALAGWRIVLDPGHGGNEQGAPSAIKGNSPEADLNLAVALHAGGLLQAVGAEVRYTRTADVTATETALSLSAELRARAAVAEEFDADLLVSIHHNSTADSFHNHTEVYRQLFSRSASYGVARRILNRLGQVYPALDSALLAGNFAVLRSTGRDAVLVECAYLSDRRLAPHLETLRLIKSEAAAIAGGVLDFATDPMAEPMIGASVEGDSWRVRVRSNRPLGSIHLDDGGPAFRSEETTAAIFVADVSRRRTGMMRITVVDPGGVAWSREFIDRSAARPDTRPLVVIAAPATLIPESATLASESFAIRFIDASGTNTDLLERIERLAPDLAVIVVKGRADHFRHYFRSEQGRRLAEALARSAGGRSASGSHYLLSHTSMTALLAESAGKPDWTRWAKAIDEYWAAVSARTR